MGKISERLAAGGRGNNQAKQVVSEVNDEAGSGSIIVDGSVPLDNKA
jgi:hypothetical protein